VAGWHSMKKTASCQLIARRHNDQMSDDWSLSHTYHGNVRMQQQQLKREISDDFETATKTMLCATKHSQTCNNITNIKKGLSRCKRNIR